MLEDNEDKNNISYEELISRNNKAQINVVNTEKDMSDKAIEKVENIINTKDHDYEFISDDVNKYKKNAVLCYLPLIVLYFIFSKKHKESKYMLFHCNQGLLCSICFAIAFIVNIISNIIFDGKDLVTNTTPTIVSFIIYLLYCISFILSIFGIVNTLNGKSKEIYVIGNIKILK